MIITNKDKGYSYIGRQSGLPVFEREESEKLFVREDNGRYYPMSEKAIESFEKSHRIMYEDSGQPEYTG